MERHSTPERIEQAWHDATRNRPITDRMTAERAHAWLAAWAEKAAEDGIQRGAAYRDAGWGWVEEQRRRRVRPE